jgi:hypothetical protein
MLDSPGCACYMLCITFSVYVRQMTTEMTPHISYGQVVMSTPELQTSQGGVTFRVGEALGQALAVLGRNLLPFLLVTAIGYLPLLYVQWQLRVEALNGSGINVPVYLGSIAVQLFLRMLCQAALVYATFQSLRGRPVNILQSCGHALRRAVPLVLTGLLYTLVVLIGLVLLVVPGYIAMCGLLVVIPACMVEKLGPAASLSRSWQLTEFHKGAIFGVLIALSIGGGVISYIFRQIHEPVAYLIAVYAWDALFATYSAVLFTLIYHGLRVEKEGIDVDQIAAVFD